MQAIIRHGQRKAGTKYFLTKITVAICNNNNNNIIHTSRVVVAVTIKDDIFLSPYLPRDELCDPLWRWWRSESTSNSR
jgi:hypothetical protein